MLLCLLILRGLKILNQGLLLLTFSPKMAPQNAAMRYCVVPFNCFQLASFNSINHCLRPFLKNFFFFSNKCHFLTTKMEAFYLSDLSFLFQFCLEKPLLRHRVFKVSLFTGKTDFSSIVPVTFNTLSTCMWWSPSSINDK